MGETVHSEDLSPGRFRGLLGSLGTLLNSIGHDALTQILAVLRSTRCAACRAGT